MLKIIGLGPGDPGHISAAALDAMAAAETVFLQTEKLPQATALAMKSIDWTGMDMLYESASDYIHLNMDIAETLIESATNGDTCYCVYGSGTEGQQAVALAMELAAKQGIETTVIPGISAVTQAATLAGLHESCQAHYSPPDMNRIDTTAAHVLCDLDRQLKASEFKIALMELYPEDFPITLVVFSIPSTLVYKIPLEDLDRLDEYSPYTFAVLPASELLQRRRFNMADLNEICRMLRAPDGCPWDREQTHFSLKRNMLEEAQEALAAIDAGDMDNLCEELGDVLLQVALHGEIAREHSEFGLLDITSGICAKMINRHPHVFGDVRADTADQVLHNWEIIKSREPGHEPAGFGEKYTGLPGLTRAHKIQKEAAKFGFDWDEPAQAKEKLLEEAGELLRAVESEGAGRVEAEAGDLLFAAVNMARLAGVDSETAIHGCIERFTSRINAMKAFAANEGKSLDDYSLDGLNALWGLAKSRE